MPLLSAKVRVPSCKRKGIIDPHGGLSWLLALSGPMLGMSVGSYFAMIAQYFSGVMR
jgi:hypothetical protein